MLDRYFSALVASLLALFSATAADDADVRQTEVAATFAYASLAAPPIAPAPTPAPPQPTAKPKAVTPTPGVYYPLSPIIRRRFYR